jgi:long-chain-alcohol oxidase
MLVDSVHLDLSYYQIETAQKLMPGPYGEKQGTVETFMVDAAKSGAKFLVGAQVDRLIFCRPHEPTPETIIDSELHKYYPNVHRTKCFGALLTLKDGTKAAVLASKSVVVCGGSINSPAILLRSKVRNPNIGRNLHLHPCTYVTAYFDEQINPWEGAIMTAVSLRMGQCD